MRFLEMWAVEGHCHMSLGVSRIHLPMLDSFKGIDGFDYLC